MGIPAYELKQYRVHFKGWSEVDAKNAEDAAEILEGLLGSVVMDFTIGDIEKVEGEPPFVAEDGSC